MTRDQRNEYLRHGLEAAIEREEEHLDELRRQLESLIGTNGMASKRAAIVEHVKRGTPKGFKYRKGTHWMQQPKNRARLMKQIAKMRRAKKARTS
jgi:rubrerythrin